MLMCLFPRWSSAQVSTNTSATNLTNSCRKVKRTSCCCFRGVVWLNYFRLQISISALLKPRHHVVTVKLLSCTVRVKQAELRRVSKGAPSGEFAVVCFSLTFDLSTYITLWFKCKSSPMQTALHPLALPLDLLGVTVGALEKPGAGHQSITGLLMLTSGVKI